MNDTFEKGAIYKITNKANGKVYIGLTVNYKARKKNHYNLLIRNAHYNQHLQKAWNKYGEANFKIETLVEGVETSEELNALEIMYIEQFKAYDPEHGYNKTYGGGGVRHTEETKAKVRKALTGKVKSDEHIRKLKESKRMAAINTSARMSEETKQKWLAGKRERMTGSNNPMYGKEISDEHREKLRIASRGKSNPMTGKNIKDYMTAEAYEQWKKNVAHHGASNGRARETIVIYENTVYRFDYCAKAIEYFNKIEGVHVSVNWIYRGINPKYRTTFQYFGYADQYEAEFAQ